MSTIVKVQISRYKRSKKHVGFITEVAEFATHVAPVHGKQHEFSSLECHTEPPEQNPIAMRLRELPALRVIENSITSTFIFEPSVLSVGAACALFAEGYTET